MTASRSADRAAPPAPVATREIRRWETSGGEVAVVELQDYEGGRRVIAFRRWYRDGEGVLRPGRSGLSFPLGDLDEIESAVEALRALSPRPPEPAEAPEDRTEPGPAAAPAPFRPQPFPRLWRPGLPPPPPRPVPPRNPAPSTAVGHDPAPRSGPASAAPKAASPAPAPTPREPAGPQQRRPSMLAEIFARGLVASPLALRLEVRGQDVTGQAFADGSLVFGNRRFGNPREAVAVLRGQQRVIDAWSILRYRNPQTNRFARLSRLRALFQGMSEGDEAGADGEDAFG